MTTLNRWANQNVVFPIIWGVVRISIVRFHMTSRRPYLCTKQWIGGHVCVQKNPVEVKLFSHVKTFFNSKQFAKQLLLTTWLETICQTAPIQKYRFTAKSLHDHCAISSIVQFLDTKKQCKFKILDGKQGVLWFLKIRLIKRVHVCIFIDSLKAAIDRFQSRGQQLCKLLGIKESFNMSEFKAHRIFLGTQTWPPIHCFVHKFGRRDLLWKRSIDNPLSWKFLYIVFSPIILLGYTWIVGNKRWQAKHYFFFSVSREAGY